jgi:DNA-binding XRE family transcriptional regulator
MLCNDAQYRDYNPYITSVFFHYLPVMSKAKHRRNEAAITLLAHNIRKYRQLKKLTIQELAFRLDADYSQVGRMERGKVNFSVSLIFDLADALGIQPAQLFETV